MNSTPSKLKFARLSSFMLSCITGLTLSTAGAVLAADSTEQILVIDGHNDLPWQYKQRFSNRLAPLDITERHADLDPPLHTDLPRLREGGVGAQFWSVYVPISEYGGSPGDAAMVMEQIDVVRRMVERYPDDLALAFTAQDVRDAMAAGKIGSLMGIEGGHAIENSLGVLRSLYEAGARYMTLTHSKGLEWADSATDEHRHDGLTGFGVSVVEEMNRLGMLVDLSHVTEATMHDALDVAEAPVIFSHSSARGVTDHPRNVPDSVLQRLRKNDGVVMVTFVPAYVDQGQRNWSLQQQGEQARLQAIYPFDKKQRDALLAAWEEENPSPGADIADVADHVDHIRKVAGIAHIGLGGDFDGISNVPEGLEDVSTYPALFAELRRRGYSDTDLKAIGSENLLRVFAKSEAAAAALQSERLAADPVVDAEVMPGDE